MPAGLPDAATAHGVGVTLPMVMLALSLTWKENEIVMKRILSFASARTLTSSANRVGRCDSNVTLACAYASSVTEALTTRKSTSA